jgi:hypothetical protein
MKHRASGKPRISAPVLPLAILVLVLLTGAVIGGSFFRPKQFFAGGYVYGIIGSLKYGEEYRKQHETWKQRGFWGCFLSFGDITWICGVMRLPTSSSSPAGPPRARPVASPAR